MKRFGRKKTNRALREQQASHLIYILTVDDKALEIYPKTDKDPS